MSRSGSVRWSIPASSFASSGHSVRSFARHPSISNNAARRTLAELSGHDCLVYSQDSISSEWPLLDGGGPTQVQVPVRMRSNTLDGVVAAAVEGAGLVYAPAWSVMNFVKAGRLKVILSEHELPPRRINAVFTHNRLLSGKVRALVDYLALQFVDTDFDSPPPLHTTRLG